MLIVGANLPDIDAVAVLFGPDANLLWRRGWTHGVLAIALLPWLLVEAVLWHGRRYRGSAAATDTHRWRLLGLAYLAVMSHPLLDWLNTYGVRFLMPFDDRWFYGDALVVVDPWMWLLAGASTVLAHSHSRRSRIGWLTVATLTTALVMLAPGVPPSARGLWTAGVLALALSVRGRPQQGAVRVVARGGLATLVLYLAVMIVASSRAGEQATRWWRAQGAQVERVVVNPASANPSRHRVIGVTADAYYFVDTQWMTGTPPRTAAAPLPLPRGDIAAAIRAARSAGSVRGFVGWTRLPSYAVRATPGGYLVTLRDLRYSRDGSTGFGTAFVRLDEQLQVLD